MKTEINQMEAKKIKIILADNRTIVRTCISHLMNHHNANIQVIGEALDGWHLLKLVASIKCDIVLLDAIMPGPSTLDIIKNLKSEFRQQGIDVVLCEITFVGHVERVAPSNKIPNDWNFHV